MPARLTGVDGWPDGLINWLLGSKVLLSPIAVDKVDFSSGRVNVTLTKKQVEESPSIVTDKLVSRQHEASYHDYYGYPYYWSGPYFWEALGFNVTT
jgi:hypothetical protein